MTNIPANSSDIYDHPAHLVRSNSRHSDVHQPDGGSRPPSNKTVDSSSERDRLQQRDQRTSQSHTPNEYGVRTTPPASSDHHQVRMCGIFICGKTKQATLLYSI